MNDWHIDWPVYGYGGVKPGQCLNEKILKINIYKSKERVRRIK